MKIIIVVKFRRAGMQVPPVLDICCTVLYFIYSTIRPYHIRASHTLCYTSLPTLLPRTLYSPSLLLSAPLVYELLCLSLSFSPSPSFSCNIFFVLPSSLLSSSHFCHYFHCSLTSLPLYIIFFLPLPPYLGLFVLLFTHKKKKKHYTVQFFLFYSSLPFLCDSPFVDYFVVLRFLFFSHFCLLLFIFFYARVRIVYLSLYLLL